MSGYVPSRNRVCAYSYVNEKDLPPGQKLLNCSKCKETCYIDRESQVACWKVHKETCDPVSKDFSREHSMRVFDSVHMCALQMKSMLDIGVQRRIQGRLLLYYLQQLRGLVIANANNLSDWDTGAIIALSERFDEVLQDEDDRRLIWSIPGFANYMLSEEILLSDEMKARMQANGPLPPKEVFVEYCEVDYTTSYENPITLPKQYWKLLLGIYSNSALIDDPRIKDLLPRNTSLTAAIIAHIMKAWTNPYIRASMSSSRDLNDNSITLQHLVSVCFAQALDNGNFQNCHERWRRDDEIVPGITVKDYLKTSMLHEAYFAGRDLESVTTCLLMLKPGFPREILDDHLKRAVVNLSPKDRFELLDIFLDWTPIRKKNGDEIDLPILSYMAPPTLPLDTVRETMLVLILEASTREFLILYHYMKETEKSKGVSEQVEQFMQDYYDNIMRDSVPTLAKNFHILLNECNRKKKEVGETGITLPFELREMIYQYALDPASFGSVPYTPSGNMTTKLRSYLRSIGRN